MLWNRQVVLIAAVIRGLPGGGERWTEVSQLVLGGKKGGDHRKGEVAVFSGIH